MTLPLPPPLTLLPGPPGVNHGAGLVALGNGDLLACWYSGRSEAGPDVVVLCSRGAQDGSRWSAPWTVSPPHERAAGAPRPAKSAGNVALARDAAGRLPDLALRADRLQDFDGRRGELVGPDAA
jgi:predicted neuraminidase